MDRRAVVVGKARRPEMGGLADAPADGGKMLSRTDARHVVVLRQRREVLVQLFYALLVCFRAAFALESVVEL